MSPSTYDTRRGPQWRVAGVWSAGFVAVLWLSEIIDTALGNRLDAEGIRPGSTDGLSGILFAPLLHGGFGHLIANTVPLLVLGFLVLLSGLRQWVAVTAGVWLIGGVGTWLFGGIGTVHIGASGVVFGWLAYLVVRGVFTRQPWQILLGIAVFLVYGGALWGVFPGQPGISWQGHLFGAVGGIVVAWMLADRGAVRRNA
ncbi:rhomboid family intramembrane serine protease [Nocardioides allogilvus]|uniref:rhomboid family intramembrane serine protease n=1 Tax=Nocardioides allogilvus TaxID=2072017 RepID=UPI000D2FF9CD|nr:rhomboid family intramembrane serine protease [Nocardioides allogilvus]